MSFLAPAFLALVSLTLVVLALHVRRRERLYVPSLEIWRQLQMPETVKRRRLHWPQPSLALFLQLAAVIFLALALAQPLFGTGRNPESWIVLIDGSASMQVRDENGISRFDAAVARASELADAAGPDNLSRISLVVAGTSPNLVLARQAYHPSLLAQQAAGLMPDDGPAGWEAVAGVLHSLYRSDENTRLLVLTDSPMPQPLRDGLPADITADLFSFGTSAPNAGIYAEVTPVDPARNRWAIAGEVTMTGGLTQANVALQFTPNDGEAPLDWASISINSAYRPATDGTAPATTIRKFDRDIDLPGPGVLSVRLDDDAAPFDNAAHFVLRAEPKTFDVLYIGTSQQPVVRALQAIDGVKVFSAAAPPAELDDFDLVIVDDVAIARAPATNTLWIARGRVAVEAEPRPLVEVDPVNWRNDHPLARATTWVSLGIGTVYAVPVWPDADILLEAREGALVQARTGSFGREVRFAFDPAQSTWPSQASFPSFIAHLVQWIRPHSTGMTAPSCMIGLPCAIDARLYGDGAAVTAIPATAPGAEPIRASISVPANDGFVPRHAGLFRLQRGSHSDWLAVNAVPSDESLLEGGGEPRQPSVPAWPTKLWPPIAVLLLVLLVVEAAVFFRSHSRASSTARRNLLLGLRGGALMMVAAALLALPLPVWSDAGATILALATPPTTSGPLLTRTIEDANGRSLGVVALGAPPSVVADLGAPATELSTPSLAAGGDSLRLAAALVPPGANGRIVLEDAGTRLPDDFNTALPFLRAHGISIDNVSSPTATDNTLVHRVEAPAAVYAGDDITLTGLIYAPAATSAELTVFADATPVTSQPIALQAGFNRVEMPILDVPAVKTFYEMQVIAPGDTDRANDRNGVIVAPIAPEGIALIAADPDQGRAFAEALADQGFKATVMAPDRAPHDLKGWLAYRAFVLLNVPAIDLITTQQGLIETAVQVHGRGLVIIGGDTSFGPGGYLETPLDRLSPLSSRVPREAPEVALAFVLDRSGSMQQPVGNVTRLDIAKQATASAIGLLNPQSQVSITVFDDVAQTILPMQTVPSQDQILTALGQLDSGGGTAIYPGLEQAFEQLRNVAAPAKHVIVMTDGLTQQGDFPGLVGRMRTAGITVSGVAIGSGAERRTVESIAQAGGGAFHTTADVAALPSILSQEAMMLSGAPIETGAAQPRWTGAGSPFLDDLPEVMPPIEGFVLTTAKPEAEVYMTAPDSKGEQMPLLAHWRYGNGQVLALTTNAASAWTQAWQMLPGYSAFWAGALRQHLPGNATPGLTIITTLQGDEILVDLYALGADGVALAGLDIEASILTPSAAERKLSVLEVSAGHYQGRTPAPQPGDYTITAASGDHSANHVLHVAYPAWRGVARPSKTAPILAAATGGHLIKPGEPLLASQQMRWTSVPGWQAFLLAALLLFLGLLLLQYARPVAWLRSFAGQGPTSTKAGAPSAAGTAIPATLESA